MKYIIAPIRSGKIHPPLRQAILRKKGMRVQMRSKGLSCHPSPPLFLITIPITALIPSLLTTLLFYNPKGDVYRIASPAQKSPSYSL